MIILFRAYGNHSNRLFQSLHFEAYCMEHGVEYCNLTFRDLEKYYVNPVTTREYAASELLLKFIPLALVGGLDFMGLSVFDGGSAKSINKSRLGQGGNYYVAGWGFRTHELTLKHQDVLRLKYALKTEYYHDNDLYSYIKRVDRSKNVLVGIHIRRGDYEKIDNGIYYFSDEVYGRYIKMLSEEINAKINKRALFVIFSNEVVNFREDDQTKISRNSWFVDHHLMSECDYLMGPPSTFTLWASYIGRVKYFHIKDRAGQVGLDDFEYCHG